MKPVKPPVGGAVSETCQSLAMGNLKEPKPAKLFMSLLASEEAVLRDAMEDLSGAFGTIDYLSERFSFDFTDYYSEEMGKDLFRHFITFGPLIPIPSLPEVKERTRTLEARYAIAPGKRRINIDPGYLCLEHVVLATHKAYTHRPYLRDGVFADLTLIFQAKSFRPLEWTYPDYRQAEIVCLFNRLRVRYLQDLKKE
jgi:hypothetical protein